MAARFVLHLDARTKKHAKHGDLCTGGKAPAFGSGFQRADGVLQTHAPSRHSVTFRPLMQIKQFAPYEFQKFLKSHEQLS